MIRRVLVGFAVVCGAVLLFGTPPAGAASTHVNGPCQGSGTFKSNGLTVPASEEGTVTIPVKDDVAWTGSIAAPAGKTPYSGHIQLELPWPMPSLTIDDWSGTTDSTSNSGVKHYDLPSFVPRGVDLAVTGSHDQGSAHCDGHVTVKIAGGALDSPAAPAAVIGTVLSGGVLALAGRVKGGVVA